MKNIEAIVVVELPLDEAGRPDLKHLPYTDGECPTSNIVFVNPDMDGIRPHAGEAIMFYAEKHGVSLLAEDQEQLDYESCAETAVCRSGDKSSIYIARIIGGILNMD